jgi:hypothetical protein
MKVHTPIAVMLCLTVLTTGACVSRSTHNAAVADLEASRVELNNTKAQSQALTEQMSELEQHKLLIAQQLDATTLAYKRAAQQREAERVAWQRLNKLGRMVSQLAAEQNNLKYALQRENKAQVKLQASVEQYRSELDETARVSEAPASHPLINRTDQPGGTTPPGQVTAQPDSAPMPSVVAHAAPATSPVANPVPRQPVNQAPPEPVEQDWLSWFQEWVMSLFSSILP